MDTFILHLFREWATNKVNWLDAQSSHPRRDFHMFLFIISSRMVLSPSVVEWILWVFSSPGIKLLKLITYLPLVHVSKMCWALPLCPLHAFIMWIPKVHYHVHRCLTPHFPKNHLNIIHACHISCLAHPHWFDHPHNISWRVQIMKLLMQFSPFFYFPFMNP
jgi:hypothetical protein